MGKKKSSNKTTPSKDMTNTTGVTLGSDNRPTRASSHPSKAKDEKSYNPEGKILFSNLQFTLPPIGPGLDSQRAKDKKYSGMTKKQKLQAMLRDVKRERAAINSIVGSDPDKGNLVKRKRQWRKAIELAEGKKIRDDPSKIQKSIKSLDRKKTKHKKEWDKRQDHVKEQMDRRQVKRSRNIKKRIDAKKENKLKKLRKKGRLVSSKKW